MMFFLLRLYAYGNARIHRKPHFTQDTPSNRQPNNGQPIRGAHACRECVGMSMSKLVPEC